MSRPGNLVSLLVALLLLAAASLPVFAQVPTDGLVGEYLFSNAAFGSAPPALDTSGNGNDGRVDVSTNCMLPDADRFNSAQAAWKFYEPAPLPLGGSCSFDDPAYVQITRSNPNTLPPIQLINSFTVAAWYKPVDGSIEGWIVGQIDEQEISVSDPWFRLVVDSDPHVSGLASDTLHLVIPSAGTCATGVTPNDTIVLSDTQALPIAEWTFMAATLEFEAASNTSTATLYRGRQSDGQVSSTSQTAAGPCTNVGMNAGSVIDRIYVGHPGRSEQQPFGELHGVVDDVRIYDRALSAAEVSALFREGGYVNSQPQSLPIDPNPQQTPAGVDFLLELNPFFSDPDGDLLDFSVSGLPAGMNLVRTDRINQDPLWTIEGSGTASDLLIGTFSVTVEATDIHGASITQMFSLVLTNEPTSLLAPIPDVETIAPDKIAIDLAPYFDDPDNQSLSFEVAVVNNDGVDVSSFFLIDNQLNPGLMTSTTFSPLLLETPLSFVVDVDDVDSQGFDLDLNATARGTFLLEVSQTAARDYRFERFFPSLQQPWYFSGISSLAGGPSGTIYVADALNGRIGRFSRDGLLITQWGRLGAADGQFVLQSLRVSVGQDGRVFVSSGNRVQVFTPNGQHLDTATFADPVLDVGVDALGMIYVLTSSGVEFGPVDQLQALPSLIPIANPDNLVVAPNGDLFIGRSDSPPNVNRVQRLDAPDYVSGTEFPVADADDLALGRDGNLYALGSLDDLLRVYDTGGLELFTRDLSSFKQGRLSALAVDVLGRFYFADDGSVFGINEDASAQTFAWRSGSEMAGQFISPIDVSVDDDGTLYVLEPFLSRVQRFTSAGLAIGVPWPLQSPIQNPESTRAHIQSAHLFGSEVIAVSTPQSLTLYAPDGSDPGNQIALSGPPGPIGLTQSGQLVVAQPLGGGNTVVDVVQSDGTLDVEDQFSLPGCQVGDLSVSPSNIVYVLCLNTLEVLAVTLSSGAVLGSFDLGTSGLTPQAIHIDPQGVLHVIEYAGVFDDVVGGTELDSRIRLVRNMVDTPVEISTSPIGTSGYTAGRFDFVGPSAGASLLGDGRLVLAESGNNRIQVLSRASLSNNNKAIIVAGGGDYPENYLWEATQINTNNAYDKLIYQGFTAERILYLHPDPDLNLDGNVFTQEVDGEPTIAALQAAFGPGGFAADADNLVVYFADHGDVDEFRVNPIEILSSSTIKGWLDQLQTTVWPSQQGLSRGWVTFVYEACESGSFQDDLAFADQVPENKRVVITTSNEGQNANFIAQGFLSFSYQFWVNIFNGLDVRDGFAGATFTILDTYPAQEPILTVVNGGQQQGQIIGAVETGNLGTLFSDDDFGARNIGNGTSNNFAGPVIINPDLPTNGIMGTASATISVECIEGTGDTMCMPEPDNIARAWVVITPPTYGDVVDPENPVLELPTIDLATDDCAPGFEYCATFDGFTTEGDYEIDILAQDTFGNFTQYTEAPLVISVGNPPKNKAVVLASGGDDSRGLAFIDNGEFAYQALLRQDYADDRADDTDIIDTVAEDEIRYYTLGTGVVPSPEDGRPPTEDLISSLITSSFISAETLNVVIYVAADFDPETDTFAFPGSPPLALDHLVALLDAVESTIKASGRVTVVLEGSSSGSSIPILVGGSSRRFVVSSASSGEIASLVDAGGISFSKFFWNAIRDGFALSTSFELARNAISITGQRALLDDNGNGLPNDIGDGLTTRDFFLGPGIIRAGNGPLIGRIPDIVIDDEFQNTATITAENVTATSAVDDVVGTVAVAGTRIPAEEFSMAPVGGTRGQINLGDFEGTYDNFIFAGDYDIAVYARDINGNPSTPATQLARKTAGPDIFEIDDTPATSTLLSRGRQPQRHTLHTSNEQDWFTLVLPEIAPRFFELQLSSIDPRLTLLVELYPGAALTDPGTPPVPGFGGVVIPSMGLTTTIPIPDSDNLPAGIYYLRIVRNSFDSGSAGDPSPGYSIGVSEPIALDPGLFIGQVVKGPGPLGADETTGDPVPGALIRAVNSEGIAGDETLSCNGPSCGGAGQFDLSLVQGDYTIEIIADGYDSRVFDGAEGITIEPRAVVTLNEEPILLTPQVDLNEPTVIAIGGEPTGETAVRLFATVNANGTGASARFQFGLDEISLQPTGNQYAVSGSQPIMVETMVAGLTCESEFFFRLVVANAETTILSAVSRVTTALCGVDDVLFSDGFE